jgi:PH domain associated with Beige/BEACH
LSLPSLIELHRQLFWCFAALRVTQPEVWYADCAMVSSWFYGSAPEPKSLPLKQLIQLLQVKKNACKFEVEARSRFSSLQLEHGEVPVDSWAVVAYSSPTTQEEVNQAVRPELATIQWEQAPLRVQLNRPSRKIASAVSKEEYPSLHWTKCQGRLHLCTRSLVLEPSDPSRPLIRCPFSKMNESPREYPSESTFESMSVEFVTSKHIVIPSHPGPFTTVSIPGRFRLTFLHSSPTPFVKLCHQLWQLATHKTPHNGHSLDELLQPMWERPFDMANLVDIREPLCTSHLPCHLLRPLQSFPGVMVLTQERLYFQPAAGVLSHAETRAAWCYPLRDLMATARRYHGLRDSALELYWADESSTLLALERRHDRETVLRYLSVPCV